MRYLLLCLALAACGDSPTAPTITLTGAWSGTIDGQTLYLVLSEGAGGAVTGTGSLTYPGAGGVALTASGTHVAPNVSLVLEASGYDDTSFTGTVTATEIQAYLNGSGFLNDYVLMARQ